jgi:hypothetical protein
MTKTIQNHIIKHWKKVLEEYELIKIKQNPHFNTVKSLCEFYDISPKQLHKYRNRFLNTGGNVKSLLPKKRGPNTWGKRTPKPIERTIVSAYRKLGYNRYELVDLFEPIYKHKTPAASTMYLIIKRYQRGLRKKEKEAIKRYEKKYPGEMGHIDAYYLPKSTLKPLGLKKGFLCGLVDDCTRLLYVEVLLDIKAETTAGFLGRALSFFYRNYGIRFESIMTDNGSEFVGREFKFLLNQLKIKHIRTKPYTPKTNGKIEAVWKILNREFFYPNKYLNMKELVYNLGEYLYHFNNYRKHGGLEYITPYDKYQKVSKFITEILD